MLTKLSFTTKTHALSRQDGNNEQTVGLYRPHNLQNTPKLTSLKRLLMYNFMFTVCCFNFIIIIIIILQCFWPVCSLLLQGQVSTATVPHTYFKYAPALQSISSSFHLEMRSAAQMSEHQTPVNQNVKRGETGDEASVKRNFCRAAIRRAGSINEEQSHHMSQALQIHLNHPGNTWKTVQGVYICVRACVHQGFSEGISHLDWCAQPGPHFHSFGRQSGPTLTGGSHDFGRLSSSEFPECSIRLHDVRLCCLCVSPAEQDGLAPSLTRGIVKMQTDSEAPRVRGKRGRDPRSNSIIEIVSRLNY